MDRPLAMNGAEATPDGDLRAGRPQSVTLSILIVTFNSRDKLPSLIRSLQESPPGRSWELVVCDNGSDDDSVALIEGAFPRAIIVRGRGNRGFAAGVNAAAERARGKYFLLLNPDVSWEGAVLDRLVSSLAERPAAAAMTPRLCFPDGRPQPCMRRFPTHTNIWFSRGTPWANRTTVGNHRQRYTLNYPVSATRTDAVAAACLLLRADAFAAVGGMDTAYFLYVEDTDLCRRLTDAGWEIWVDPGISVTHDWGAAETRDPKICRYHYRSLTYYFRKFHPRARVRNTVLFGVLRLMELLTRLRQAVGPSKGSTE